MALNPQLSEIMMMPTTKRRDAKLHPSDASSTRTKRTIAKSIQNNSNDTERRSSVGELSDVTSSRPRKLQVENTFKMEPDVKFSPCIVEKIAERVLAEELHDTEYDPDRCKELSQKLAAAIMERVKGLSYKRYKLVALVTIGSLKERPGMHFGSRCLWNHKLDTFATVKFANRSLFALANIYGLYFE